MRKRLGLLVLVLPVLCSLVLAVVLPNDASAWSDGRHDTTDGRHIKTISCQRWDNVTPDGESSTDNKATVTFVFSDDFKYEAVYDVGEGWFTWLDCKMNVEDRMSELTTGSASDFKSCAEIYGSCWESSAGSDKTYSRHNANWVVYPDDAPPDGLTVSVSPDALTMAMECTTTTWTTSNSEPGYATVTMSDGSNNWEVVNPDASWGVTKEGNQVKVVGLGILCPTTVGSKTVNHDVVVGIKGTDVRATVKVTVNINTTDPFAPPTPGGNVDGGGTIEVDPCFGNAGALGWIVCPVITMANEVLEWLYGQIEQRYLAVNSNIFTNVDTGVQSAWGTIRDIANILFVILILVVIVSQLTGFGIDNYGVKKILPKLIIAGILINLSLVVCQLAVDVSNIVGYGLKGFLGNAVALTPQAVAAGASPSGMQITANVFIGAGAVAAVILINPAVIITLLVFVVTALISVLFMWVILLVRQVGVILAVIVSPLAFACYLLPNTQTLFKKWVNIFKGLLLVFPLCSLLIGGGTMGAKILANAGAGMPAGEGGTFLLAAMVLQVVPFFFVPMLLKGSLAGLGNIGAKLSGLGSGLRRKASQGVNNAEMTKQFKSRLNAGVNKKGEVTGLGKVRAGFANSKVGRRVGAQGTMARNRAAYLKQQREVAAAANMMGTGFAAAQARQQTDIEKEELDNEIALINKDTNKGENEDALYSAYDQAIASGNKVRVRAIAEVAGRRKDTAARFTQRMKDDMADGKYNGRGDVMEAVSKQIATGENSKQYRGTDALAFEYASQYNRGETRESYGDWVSKSKNINSAIQNHITNGQELYGQKGKVLDELRSRTSAAAAAGDATAKKDMAYLADLASRAQEEASQTGVYDQTKEDAMARFQGHADVSAQQAAKQAAQAAEQAAKQAEQDKVFDVQKRALRAAHEQNARARGLEAVRIGSTLQNSGREVDGYAPPSGEGFDLTNAGSVEGGVIVAGSVTPSDVIITSADGKTKWNITKGRYES